MRPAKSPISLGIHTVWSESSMFAQWVAKDPRFLRIANTLISLGIHAVWSESSMCTQWVAKDPRFLRTVKTLIWLMFWAGCGIWLYPVLVIAFSSTNSSTNQWCLIKCIVSLSLVKKEVLYFQPTWSVIVVMSFLAELQSNLLLYRKSEMAT